MKIQINILLNISDCVLKEKYWYDKKFDNQWGKLIITWFMSHTTLLTFPVLKPEYSKMTRSIPQLSQHSSTPMLTRCLSHKWHSKFNESCYPFSFQKSDPDITKFCNYKENAQPWYTKLNYKWTDEIKYITNIFQLIWNLIRISLIKLRYSHLHHGHVELIQSVSEKKLKWAGVPRWNTRDTIKIQSVVSLLRPHLKEVNTLWLLPNEHRTKSQSSLCLQMP